MGGGEVGHLRGILFLGDYQESLVDIGLHLKCRVVLRDSFLLECCKSKFSASGNTVRLFQRLILSHQELARQSTRLNT